MESKVEIEPEDESEEIPVINLEDLRQRVEQSMQIEDTASTEEIESDELLATALSQNEEYEETVVEINRISKTVKGGRRMRFSALVVIGNKKGKFGWGTGKAAEVPDAIKKALEAAKRNTFELHIVKGGTLAHEIVGKFGACSVFLKPAPEGTGIIAGGPVRAILELAGIRNVTSKVYGSRAPINIIRATKNGLSNLKSYKQVQALRAKAE